MMASKYTLQALMALPSMPYSQELDAHLAVLALFQIRPPKLQL
jgi:hypothetical protein